MKSTFPGLAGQTGTPGPPGESGEPGPDAELVLFLFSLYFSLEKQLVDQLS